MTPEKQLKNRIRTYLRFAGAYVYAPVPRGMGMPTVDFICCWRGRFLAVEVKVAGGKPTKRQELTLAEVRRAGGWSFWCDSFEDFVAKLDMLPDGRASGMLA